MKFFYSSPLITFFCILVFSSNVNGQTWQSLGKAGFSKGEAIGIKLVVSENQLYVAYNDFSYNGSLKVMKYIAPNWTDVGTNSIYDSTWKFDFAIQSGVPNIAYSRNTLYIDSLGYKYLNNNVWTNKPGFHNCVASINAVTNIKLSYSSNISKVGYTAYGMKSFKLVDSSCTGYTDSSGVWYGVNDLSLSENNNITYAAMAGATIKVHKYENNKISPLGMDGFFGDTVKYIDLKFNSGTPYVLIVGDDFKISVMNFNGTNWNFVGNKGFTPIVKSNASLAFKGNTPVIAYVNRQTSMVELMIYNNGTWTPMAKTNALARSGYGLNLIYNDTTPYIAFSDARQSGKISVIHLAPVRNLVQKSNSMLPAVYGSSLASADIDQDGDFDIFVTGINSSGAQISELYINDGKGNMTISGQSFPGISLGTVLFFDLDNDGDQDLLLTGGTSTGAISNIYLNKQGQFSLVFPSGLLSASASSAAVADVNLDGWLDLIISGNTGGGGNTSLYMNNQGVLIRSTTQPFDPVYSGTVAFSDFDKDGDQDLMVTGRPLGNTPFFYENKDSGNFVFNQNISNQFYPLYASAVAFADINCDGYPDILTTGNTTSNATSSLANYPMALQYGPNFQLGAATVFNGVQSGALGFKDIDKDGDLDFFYCGQQYNASAPIAALMLNDGTGNFYQANNPSFPGVYTSSVLFSDINGDGYDDLIYTGSNGNSPYLYLFMNQKK